MKFYPGELACVNRVAIKRKNREGCGATALGEFVAPDQIARYQPEAQFALWVDRLMPVNLYCAPTEMAKLMSFWVIWGG